MLSSSRCNMGVQFRSPAVPGLGYLGWCWHARHRASGPRFYCWITARLYLYDLVYVAGSIHLDPDARRDASSLLVVPHTIPCRFTGFCSYAWCDFCSYAWWWWSLIDWYLLVRYGFYFIARWYCCAANQLLNWILNMLLMLCFFAKLSHPIMPYITRSFFYASC